MSAMGKKRHIMGGPSLKPKSHISHITPFTTSCAKISLFLRNALSIFN